MVRKDVIWSNMSKTFFLLNHPDETGIFRSPGLLGLFRLSSLPHPQKCAKKVPKVPKDAKKCQKVPKGVNKGRSKNIELQKCVLIIQVYTLCTPLP